MLTTFQVTDTNDDTNMGSLRWAIGQSNASAGPNTIASGTITASATTTVTVSADLSVGIVGPSGAIDVGQDLTYVATVTNKGPSPATGVTLSDTLPANVIYISARPSSGPAAVLEGGVVTDNYGDLASGSSFTLTILVYAAAGTDPLATDSASVHATESDPDTTDNATSLATPVVPVSDVSVALEPSSPTIGVGNVLTYTVTVSNAGPSIASGVLLTDVLPAGSTFVSAASISGQAPTEVSGMVVDAIGSLGANGLVVVTIKVIPTASAPAVIADNAGVSAATLDLIASNNSASVATRVLPVADLAIVKEAVSPDPAPLGQPITFTIDVADLGPSDATGAALIDTLPPGLSFVTGTAPGGPVTASGGVVTANLGSIPDGGTAVVTIVATSTAVGTFADSSKVTGAAADPNPINNNGGGTVTVTPLADVSVVLGGPPGPVFLGNPLTYTAVVTNDGPSPATDVVFTDPLPAGAGCQSVEVNQEFGTHVGGVAIQPIGTLAPGQSVTVVLSVVPDQAGAVVDTASVGATEPDPNPTNNTSRVATSLVAPYHLVEFVAPAHAVPETAGLATITLQRLGDEQGDVTVRFSTGAGGNATPGRDYQPVSVTVDLPPGVAQASVSVPVLANPFDNHDESVALQLDPPTGGASFPDAQSLVDAPRSTR